jgi:hypothetical protein
MSFYQKKYQLEFDDIIEGEFNDYKLEVHKKYEDGSSADASAELIGTGSPISINYDGDDILKPIRSSYLDINFMKINDSDNYDDLFLAENDTFKVFLYKNGSLFWQGWIGSQYISEPFISAPYQISLKAYDGLHLLKELTYITQQDAARFLDASANYMVDRWGYQQFNRVIEKFIYFTGVRNDIIYAIHLQNSDASAQADFNDFDWYNRVHHHTYLIREGESKTMTETLEDILKGLGLILYQRDGNWCIVKPSDLTITNTKYTCIKADGGTWVDESTTRQSYSTISRSVGESASLYSGDVSYQQIDGAANLTLQFPLKRVTITDKSTSNGLVATFGLDEIINTSTYGFNDWERADPSATEVVVFKYSDLNIPMEGQSDYQSYMEIDLASSGAVLNGTSSDPHLINGEDKVNRTDHPISLTGFKLKFKMRVLAVGVVSTDILRVLVSPKIYRVQTNQTYHYYIKDGVQSTEDAWLENASGDYEMNYVTVTGGEINRWKTYEIVFKPSFTNINVYMPLYGAYAVSKAVGGGDSNPQTPPYNYYYDVTYSDIELIPLPSNPTSSAQPISGVEKTDFIVESSNNYNFTKNEEISFGSKISNTGGNRLIAFNDDINNLGYAAFLANNDQPRRSWFNWTDGKYINKPLQLHLAMVYMYFYYKPVRRIEGTHYGNYKYGDLLIVDNGLNGSKGKFYPLKVSFDLKMARVNFTGDDLLDNSSLDMSKFTSKLLWNGEKSTYLEIIT